MYPSRYVHFKMFIFRLEIVVEPWMDGLFKALCKQLGIVTNIDVTTMDCPSQPVYVNIQSSTDNTNSTTTCINSTLPASDNNTPVTSNHINSCSSSIKDFNDTSQQIESKSMNVLDDGSSQTEINKDNGEFLLSNKPYILKLIYLVNVIIQTTQMKYTKSPYLSILGKIHINFFFF